MSSGATQLTCSNRDMITTLRIPSATPSLDRVGNTPLVRLEHITAHLEGIQILGKAEWANPGGSVKDRAASAIVADAQQRGFNSAMAWSARRHQRQHRHRLRHARFRQGGFPVTLCMPSNVSPERKQHPRRLRGRDHLHQPRRRLRRRHPHGPRHSPPQRPDLYFYADQYGNENNWQCPLPHGTANEIWQQTDGQRDPLHRRPRHQRHLHGHHPPPPRAQPQHPVHLHAARLPVQRPRRPQAHGNRHRPRHLRPHPRRRKHRHAHRGRLPHGQESRHATRVFWSASPPPPP